MFTEVPMASKNAARDLASSEKLQLSFGIRERVVECAMLRSSVFPASPYNKCTTPWILAGCNYQSPINSCIQNLVPKDSMLNSTTMLESDFVNLCFAFSIQFENSCLVVINPHNWMKGLYLQWASRSTKLELLTQFCLEGFSILHQFFHKHRNLLRSCKPLPHSHQRFIINRSRSGHLQQLSFRLNCPHFHFSERAPFHLLISSSHCEHSGFTPFRSSKTTTQRLGKEDARWTHQERHQSTSTILSLNLAAVS